MILVRAPLRISIGGGGTDLPSYYEKFESEFISAAIDKSIYVALNSIFSSEYLIRYSKTERVSSIEEIQHPIVREVLNHFGVKPGVEVSSFADIPAGTGLGSSGTFAVALIKAVVTYLNLSMSNEQIAELACHIEIEKLGAPIGKQDQYIAAVGGLTRFHIDKLGRVVCRPLQLETATRLELEENLLLFFTGAYRSASEVLKDQDLRSSSQDPATLLDNLHQTKELGLQIGRALESQNVRQFGELMHEHWLLKRRRSQKVSSEHINLAYEVALQNGAVGGKLIGAGGGGFLLFLSEDNRRLRKAMLGLGLSEVPFRLDRWG
ncbi:MAG: hypothetical protein WCH11_06355, partial [Bdellovibrio sp.]